MKIFGVLLKKQLLERLSFMRKDKKSVDVLGIFLSLFLLAAIVAVVVFVLSKFITMYCAIRIDKVTDIASRQFEILSVAYFGLFFFGVFSGIRSINYSIFEGDDLKTLMVLPIHSTTLFFSKIIAIYLKQIVSSAVTLLPINLTFAIVTAQSSYYVGMTVLMCFAFPLITLAVSSLLALPVYYLKRLVQSKYLIMLFLLTAAVAVLFWAYSTVLDLIKTMLTTGELRFFFREETMRGIISVTANLYPSNLFARVLLGQNVGVNCAILAGVIGGCILLGTLISHMLFVSASQMRAVPDARFRLRTKISYKKRSVSAALLAKEAYSIVRTPSYAFQYLSMAFVMPLMVFFCIEIGSDLVVSLVFVNCDFELALFLILIFGVLTNTFCATNISREGPSFFALKTMPFSHRQIVWSKVAFCAIVSLTSTLVSCVLVASLGYVSWGQAVYLMFVCGNISISQILVATRKDLNRPSFSQEEDGEIKESSVTVSFIIVVGLLTAVILGGLSLYFSIYMGAIKSRPYSGLFTYLFPSLTSLGIFGLSVAYMMIGLKERFYHLSGGN